MVQIQQQNLLASIQQGLQVRNQRQQMQAQNALRQAASQHGYDSPQAMNALGALDPRAAMQMDARRQSMDMRGQEHRLKMGQRLMQGVLSRPRGQWRQAYAQAYEQAGQMGLTLDGLPEPQAVTDDQIMAVGSALGIAPPQPTGGGGKAQETARDRMVRYLEYARGLPPEERADVLSRVEGFENFRLAGGPTAEAPVISDRMIDMALLDLDGEIPEQDEPDLSAKEEEIARYKQIYGVDDKTAVGLADGVLKLRTDDYGRGAIVNMIDGTETPLRTVTSGQPSRAPSAPAGGDAAVPDMTGGTGLEGATSSALNTLSDTLGMGLAALENEAAAREIRTLAIKGETALASEVTGRPSNYLMQRFRELMPSPNDVFQGPARTLGKVEETSDLLGQEIQAMQDIIDNARSYPPNDVAKARRRLNQLRGVKAGVDRLGRGLRRGLEGGPGSETSARDAPFNQGQDIPPAPPDIDPAEWPTLYQNMTPEERALFK